MNAYKDISPRGGVAYDLFGNGKTSNPITRIATTTTRTWIDNGNYLPECDLRSPLAQDNRAAGGDFCGAMNSNTFGTTAQTTANVDPKILNGWGVRSNTGRSARRCSSS